MNKFKPGHFFFHRHHTTAFRLYLVHSLDDEQVTYNLISLGDYPLSIDPDKSLHSLTSQKERLLSLLRTDILPLRKSETVHFSKYHYANTSTSCLSLEEYLTQINDTKYPPSPHLKDLLFKLQNILSRHIYSDANLIPHIGL